MKTLIKRIYRLLVAFFSVNWLGFLKLYDGKSKNVVWIADRSITYLFTTSIIWDLATINSLIINAKNFRIVYGKKKIGKLKNCTIFYTIHSRYNTFGLENYVAIMNSVLTELEFENTLVPMAAQAAFWENKAFMHREFDRLGIPAPHTVITTIDKLQHSDIKNYPVLIKLIHSYESKGLFKVSSAEELEEIKSHIKNKKEEILVQEILNMRKDLRVILVDGRVEHFYWRINLSDTWRPTATSKGNKVDFGNFAEPAKREIETYFTKLGLKIGAFDIAWQNDDLSSTPLVLEVSPVFSPNPLTEDEFYLHNYGVYKKVISFNGYDYKYVKLIFELKHKHISSSL